MNLTIKIQKSFKQNKSLYAVFLDVIGAFDNVNSDLLIKKLAEIGCPYKLIKFIKFLTYERHIYSSVHNESKLTHKGVPQGGILSPLLYLIYVSSIVSGIPRTVSIYQFADVIALCSTNKTSLLKVIKAIGDDLSLLGLDLAPHKTIFIDFNKNGILPGKSELKINDNIIIKSRESAKFLGIIFVYNLSFRNQISHLHNRCHRTLNILKYLQGIWWGAHPNILLTFYKSFVRSIIDYNSYVFFPTREDLSYKLEKIQYAAIRTAMGFRKTILTNGL